MPWKTTIFNSKALQKIYEKPHNLHSTYPGKILDRKTYKWIVYDIYVHLYVRICVLFRESRGLIWLTAIFFTLIESIRYDLIWWNQTFNENKGTSSEIRHQFCRTIDPLNSDDIVSEDKMFDEF